MLSAGVVEAGASVRGMASQALASLDGPEAIGQRFGVLRDRDPGARILAMASPLGAQQDQALIEEALAGRDGIVCFWSRSGCKQPQDQRLRLARSTRTK